MRQLLGPETRDELDGLLKAQEVWLNYTMEDLEREPAATGRLRLGSQMRVVVAEATPLHYLILIGVIQDFVAADDVDEAGDETLPRLGIWAGLLRG